MRFLPLRKVIAFHKGAEFKFRKGLARFFGKRDTDLTFIEGKLDGDVRDNGREFA